MTDVARIFKMLVQSSSVIVNPMVQTVHPGMPSPTDPMDEHPNNLITYLHQIAGSHEVEANVIIKDHCYARPWNWKPENVYVKPVKKLFFTRPQVAHSKDNSNQEELIDIEDTGPESVTSPFDFSKARQSMEELQRVANFVKPEDIEDWEEKIDKILWSPVQNRIFARVVRILNSERATRLAKENSFHEPIIRRTSIDSTSKKFRETLASANWDLRITQWLHCLLFDYLPRDYLAIYLDILQTLRQKVPQLIDKMIATQPNINSKGSQVTWETLGPLLKKNWDPVSPILNTYKPKKLPGNPILIVIPNGISNNLSSRQHRWITYLGNLGMIVTVNPHLGLTTNRMTMMTGMEQMVQASRAKVQEVRVDYPGRPIVVVGLNTGAGLACQVGQLEHVTAIVCLGFPFNTVDGKRGAPDDTLLDVRSPVMFVIGQNSILARVDDIEDLRERMLVPTSLVVVGSADDHLRISTSKKISEKISQSMVDRCILDEIGDFVGGILVQPHPLPLRTPNKRVEVRKRRNSNCSSVESVESHTQGVKKLRPQSPQHGNAVGNNVTGIATNVLPRGTLVTLTGTSTATQTPRRRSRATNYNNQNFSEKLISSRLTPQQSLESSPGGITLNIGSLASLAPVGPIRFEPTSISLQTPGKGTNTLKTSNAFIKVSKNNQVNITGAQNVAKIKMIMPTKKVAQRATNIYKNVNVSDKSIDMSNVNILTPTSAATIKVNAGLGTAANAQTPIITAATLPTFHTIKASMNSVPTATVKTLLPSSQPTVHFIQRTSSSSTTMATNPEATTLTKVIPAAAASGCSGKQSNIGQRSGQQRQQENTKATPNRSRSTKRQATSSVRMQADKSHKTTTTTSRSIDTIQASIPQCKSQVSLEDELANILDIPIIIANEGENLEPLHLHSADGGSQVLLVSDQGSAQSAVKYTKIILAKRSDLEENHVTPIIFTKNNRSGILNNSQLLVVEPVNDVKCTKETTINIPNYLENL